MPPKRKIHPQLYWLVHPAALALYVTIAIWLFLPLSLEKYELELIEHSKQIKHERIYYYDLNYDGESERINLGYINSDRSNDIRIQHYNQDNQVYNQWNVMGTFLRFHQLHFGNFNHNDYAEVYLLSIQSDSIFISAKELMNPSPFEIKNRFVCKAGLFNNMQTDVCDYTGKFMDIDQDGYQEFIFSLSGGFSKYPRSTFAYYIHQDSLVRSPLSASTFNSDLSFMDLNNDGIDEITAPVGSPENIHYDMPYSDSSSWLMVIDPLHMDFLFTPIKFDLGMSSTIYPTFYQYQNQAMIMLTTQPKSANKEISSWLQLYDHKGGLLKSRALETDRNLYFFNPNIDYISDAIYLIDRVGSIYHSDTSLREEMILEVKEKPNSWGINPFNYEVNDLNNDGNEEVVFIGGDRNGGRFFRVYSSELDHYIDIELPNLELIKRWSINKLNTVIKSKPSFVLQVNRFNYILSYSVNNYYSLRYLYYLLIYIGFFIIFGLLQKAQNYIAYKRFETERRLLSQQLALSKKQMEPHFILNTVNNIGYLFMKEDKKTGMYYLGKFAALMRRGLMNVDKTSISLEEEMEFVEDYLILQKQLMDGELEYQIQREENIEEDKIQIPHSLLYTFIENAIKHGLRPKEADRKISLQITKEKSRIKIVIQDNGVGRLKSKELKTTDTGQGMLIVKNIIEGYNQLHGGNISYRIEDVLEDLEVKGTLVVIWV